ncbi:hypothetical protein [Rhizobacter sp. P5_C2]
MLDIIRRLAWVPVIASLATPLCTQGADLPPGARKTSTRWHPDWSLKVQEAEPRRITTWIYNGQPDPFEGSTIARCAPSTGVLLDGKPIAVLCKQVEQRTTDDNGQWGFDAVRVPGSVDRVQRWTYNAIGQKLTAASPETGTTVWGYHADETADHRPTDLASETTSDGRVTRYTRYDRLGRLLESIDPNGIVTLQAHDLRGRLLSRNVGGRTTRYTYDAAGQLKRLTLPDGSWVGWDYDDAHRKVAVYDDQGHRIDYLLDKASNKVGENVQDPGGGLRRTLRNIVDALGRVEQGEGREVAP